MSAVFAISVFVGLIIYPIMRIGKQEDINMGISDDK